MITNKDLSIDSENGKITLNGDKYDLGTQREIDTAVKGVYSVMGQMGAKNLIPCPYYRESGYSANGMTTTYDSDGVMTINKVAGSSTAFFAITYTDDNYCLKPNTKYKLLAEFENTTQLSVFVKYGEIDVALINKKPTGKYAVNFTTPQTLEGRENIAIYATSSDTETNAKVKVMIMLASDINDDTYVPYAMTNKQLTEQVKELAGSITYTDITVNKSTTGYAAPVESAGGVFYEALATYAALDIPKDKILNIILVDCHDTAKSFNYYLGAASVGVLTDSAVSIYKDTAAADLTLRIVYKN